MYRIQWGDDWEEHKDRQERRRESNKKENDGCPVPILLFAVVLFLLFR